MAPSPEKAPPRSRGKDHVNKKKESLRIAQILEKLCEEMGATIILEPEWGYAGQITFKDGRKTYFRYNTVDLNPVAASDIAKDKDYANFFMREMGYSTVPGKTFFSDEWGEKLGIGKVRNIDAAYQYAKSIGFPVIVKPNSGSQGQGVALVHTKQEFYRAMRYIFQRDRVALVQERVSGRDYRVVVLDGKIISAYERIPLSVIGDGKKSVRKLLKEKQEHFKDIGRDTQIDFRDPRMREKLRHQGMTLDSVPVSGLTVQLLDNANLSAGGDSVDVADQISPELAALAIKLTQDMGLRLCGVDIMLNGPIDKPPQQYSILEINAAPGLDHYAAMGEAQEEIVEGLYREVLRALERGHEPFEE